MTTNESVVLDALGVPTRRAILDIVRVRASTVQEIADRLPVSRPAVSQHLRVLADAGLVRARPNGTRRIYSMAPDGLDVLRSWLDVMWRDALDSFAAFADATDTYTDTDTDTDTIGNHTRRSS